MTLFLLLKVIKRELKQRRFRATYVNRNWGLSPFNMTVNATTIVLLSVFSLIRKIFRKPQLNDAKSPLPADVRALLCCHYQLRDFTGEKCLRMLCKKLHVIYFGQCHWLRGKNAREMLLRWKKRWQLFMAVPKIQPRSHLQCQGKAPWVRGCPKCCKQYLQFKNWNTRTATVRVLQCLYWYWPLQKIP